MVVTGKFVAFLEIVEWRRMGVGPACRWCQVTCKCPVSLVVLLLYRRNVPGGI